jgi:hypothetical protein
MSGPYGDFASVRLHATVGYGANPTTVLNYTQALSSGPVMVSSTAPGSPVVSSAFSFTYGVPFLVKSTLQVYAATDNEFLFAQTVPSYFESYGGGTIDEVTVDFLSTAELAAIVIPADPFAQVGGASGENHTSKVTTALAVSPVTPDVVVYTASGTLSDDPDLLLEYGDVLDLEGATLVISAVVNRNDAPDSTTTDLGLESGDWFYTTSYSFTNRPNGAPDFAINGAGRLVAYNRFSPEVGVDAFGFDTGPEAILSDTIMELPEAFIDFDDQTQFSGAGTPILPYFSAEDIAALYGGRLEDNEMFSFDYQFNLASFTAVAVDSQSLPASSRWGGILLFAFFLASGTGLALRTQRHPRRDVP